MTSLKKIGEGVMTGVMINIFLVSFMVAIAVLVLRRKLFAISVWCDPDFSCNVCQSGCC